MNWRDVGFLVIGLFVGANVGLFVLALCVAARRGDEMGRGWGTGDGEKRGKDGGPETEDGEVTGLGYGLEYFDEQWWMKVPNRKITTKVTKRSDGSVIREHSWSDDPLFPPNT